VGTNLEGWSHQDESGIGVAQQAISNLKAGGSFARMPYWQSLLADLLASNDRRDAARANPATTPWSRRRPTMISGGSRR
jgi:hypothetical protein